MGEAFFKITPTNETTKQFEVLASMSPRYIHATRNTLYRMGKIFYNDSREYTKFGKRSGVMATVYNNETRMKKQIGTLFGETYNYPKRQRSAPGEAPQLFSGFLRSQIGFNVQGMRKLHFYNTAPYASWLEDGTKGKGGKGLGNLKPRPFLKPSMDMWGPMLPTIGQQETEKAMAAL